MTPARYEIHEYPTRAHWDSDAARLVATMLERWHLEAGAAYSGGEAGAVLAVTQADGSPAVLKVGFPHHEAVAEAIALDVWAPDFAPRVLRQDPWTWSLLLEQVVPGTPLSRSGLSADEALDVAGGLLARVHAHPVPEGVPGIRDVVGVWLQNAADFTHPRDADAGVVAAVRAHLADAAALLDSDPGGALLHGDANPGNILLSADGAWRTIDPKPMNGDPAFDLQPALDQIDNPWQHADPTAVLEERLSSFGEAVGADRDRSVRWGVARTALDLVWAWEDRDRESARHAAQRLRTWESISGA